MRRLQSKYVLFLLVILLIVGSVPSLGLPLRSTDTTVAPNSDGNQLPDSERQSLENVKPRECAFGAISVDTMAVTDLPDFPDQQFEPSDADMTTARFLLASDSDPNITRIYWQNITPGSAGDWVTWMQPGGTVRIWFEVKGPLTPGGTVVTVWFGEVVSKSSAYGDYLDAADINGLVELGVNDTQWFSWNQILPSEGIGGYGWGPGLVNAFTLRLYHPIIYPSVTPYYEGLYDKYSYLNMYGETRVAQMQWYNFTGDDPIRVAEPGWYVSPRFTVAVANAPVWSVTFRTEWRADVVWWPDVSIAWSIADLVSGKMEPGEHSVYPKALDGSGAWVFYRIDPDEVYGMGIGQRRGVYCKLFATGVEIYSSNDAGELLYVVDEIKKQAPSINLISPLDGEVFLEPELELDAFVSDPNGNFDINSIVLFTNGVATSVTGYYILSQGRLTVSVGLPQDGNLVNLTVRATDREGLSSAATVLVLSDNPLAYFPDGYSTDSNHYALSFYEKEFTLESTLTYSPGPDANFTFTPRVTVHVTPSIEFDLYTGIPSSVRAGEEFTTYMMVSDPRVSLSINIRMEADYDFTLSTCRQHGTVTLFDETWSASRQLWLGVDTLDLRYDLPGVSEYIRRFTHYEVELLSAFPVISSFASVKLTVDIVPILKIANVLSADITGASCTPALTDISFVSDRMFAVVADVEASASGSTCGLIMDQMTLEASLGLDLSAELYLSGSILSYQLLQVNLNEWLYNHLGILVPSLSLWLPSVSLPLGGTISILTEVEEQTLQIGFVGLAADESDINVTLEVTDELGNPVTGTSITAKIGSTTLFSQEIGGGLYRIVAPYRSTEFVLDVACTKSNYVGATEDFTVYVDPYVVDSSGPSIASVQNLPSSPDENEEVTVTASVTDTLTGILSVSLHYSDDNGLIWQQVTMTHVSGSTYTGTILGHSQGKTILYYIVASDGAGNQAESFQHSFTVKSATTSVTTTTSTSSTTTTLSTTTTGPTGTTGGPMGDTPLLLAGVGVAAVVVVLLVVLMRRRGS